MNARRVFRYSCFSLILVLAALPVLAGPDLRGERMPRLKGESFAADLGLAKRGALAIFNVTDERISLYVYDVEKQTLEVVWSHAAVIARDGSRWEVNIPDRNITVSMTKDASGRLAFDGKPSSLKLAPRGNLEDVIVKVRENCTAPDAQRSEPTLQQPQENLNCVMQGILGGCCVACGCVHRALDIPYWMDTICCGFGC